MCQSKDSSIIDLIEQNGITSVYEYTKTSPQNGTLDPNDIKTININLIACFSRLGEHALPFICKIIGRTYRCAIIAHVQPPKITLITEKIDFSNDFVEQNLNFHSHLLFYFSFLSFYFDVDSLYHS